MGLEQGGVPTVSRRAVGNVCVSDAHLRQPAWPSMKQQQTIAGNPSPLDAYALMSPIN